MKPREGVGASWVGWNDDGYAVGDRCRVLSDEGTHSHVRWVTGARTGSYDLVGNDNLVYDAAQANRWEDDPFGLDIMAPKRVSVACAQIVARAGVPALVAALEDEGYLDEMTSIFNDAVVAALESLTSDPTWQEVASEVGDQHEAIMSTAVRRACERAMKEAHNVGSA